MFFLLPVGVDYSARRYPMVTFTLMGINVLVYLVSLIFFFQSGQAEEWIHQNLWLIPEKSLWYTYLTSMFVHGGFFHLLFNMVYLFLFGACVEDIIGRWRFVVFYLLGGLAAVAAHIAATPEHFSSTVPLGGASGAIYACMGGFVLLLHRTHVNIRYLVFLFFRFWSGDFWLPAWVMISIYVLVDIILAVLDIVNQHVGGGTAFAAHVGGFIAGAAMIGGYKAFLKWRPPKPEVEGDELAEGELAAAVDEPRTIFLYEGGTESGPFTVSQINQMLSLGAISAETLYWQEGMPEWRAVAELTA